MLQWAEKTVEGGGIERWGDKWEEDFGQGVGTKKVGRLCRKQDIDFATSQPGLQHVYQAVMGSA